MAVLTGVMLDRGGFSIRDAAMAILRRRAEIGVSDPWSLAELGFDESDYLWLLNWTQGISRELIHNWLWSWESTALDGEEYRRSEVLGLLLLLVASEVGRRNASEGRLWPHIREVFQEDSARDLFTANAQTTQAHKDAIEDAARRFGLRNVIGLEGVQGWYGTVLLQCGFTRRGYERQLHIWLAGFQRPQAVERLLLGGPLYSPTFLRLWQSLAAVSGGNIREEKLRELLRSSPWVLPEWEASLVEAAKRERPHNLTPEREESFTSLEVPILETPRLEWPDAQEARWSSRIVNLAALEFEGAAAVLLVDREVVAQIRAMGDHAWEAEPRAISLPRRESVLVELREQAGELIQAMTCEPWEGDEDVQGWDLSSGEPVDVWQKRLHLKHSHALLVRGDMRVDPPWLESCVVDSDLTLFRLPPGQLVRIFLGEHLFWQSEVQWERASQIDPRWARGVSVVAAPREARIGTEVTLTMHCPGDVEVDLVRIAGSTFFPGVGGELGKLRIGGEHLGRGLKAYVHARWGSERARITCEISIIASGVLHSDECGNWVPSNPHRILDRDRAANSLWRIVPPAVLDGQPLMDRLRSKCVLLEGDTWIGHIGGRARPLTGLMGSGAPLEVHRSPWNLIGKGLGVAVGVRDRGACRTVERDPESGRTWVSVSHHVVLGPDHEVLWWTNSGTITIHRPTEAIDAKSGETVWELESNTLEPAAFVGICHAGHWIGTFSSRSIPDAFWEAAQYDPAQSAFLLRWFRAPLLLDELRKFAHRLVAQNLSEVLPWWILPGRGMAVAGTWLRLGDPDDRWIAVVRRLLRKWTPRKYLGPSLEDRAIALDQLLQQLGDDPLLRRGFSRKEYLAFSEAVRRLEAVDPVLLARILRDQLQLPYHSAAHVHLAHLRHDALERDNINDLRAECASRMDVDEGFLEAGLEKIAMRWLSEPQKLLGEELAETNLRNLYLATGLLPQFRRLVLLRLLDEINHPGS